METLETSAHLLISDHERESGCGRYGRQNRSKPPTITPSGVHSRWSGCHLLILSNLLMALMTLLTLRKLMDSLGRSVSSRPSTPPIRMDVRDCTVYGIVRYSLASQCSLLTTLHSSPCYGFGLDAHPIECFSPSEVIRPLPTPSEPNPIWHCRYGWWDLNPVHLLRLRHRTLQSSLP